MQPGERRVNLPEGAIQGLEHGEIGAASRWPSAVHPLVVTPPIGSLLDRPGGSVSRSPGGAR